MRGRSRPLEYMPQLDALRAVAVFLVFLAHWVPAAAILGPLGVRLFFVLSGFLITSILLRSRSDIDLYGAKWPMLLRHFYLRRMLRLYPALVLFVIAVALSGYGPTRHSWPWHITYLSNIRFAVIGGSEDGVGHLWSLSVEEQFYLFWPLMIFFTPRPRQIPLVFVLVAVGWAARVFFFVTGSFSAGQYVLPFAWLDGLGLGALLAFACEPTSRRQPIDRSRLIRLSGLFGIPIFVVAVLTKHTPHETFAILFLELGASLTFLWLVARSAEGFKGSVGKLLEFKPLIYLGQISYGLYLVHPVIPDAFKHLMREWNVALTQWDVPQTVYLFAQFVSPRFATKIAALTMLVVYTTATVGVATVSWFAWEKPFNKLRRHIAYGRRGEHSRARPIGSESSRVAESS